jgi:hypothetical protein
MRHDQVASDEKALFELSFEAFGKTEEDPGVLVGLLQIFGNQMKPVRFCKCHSGPITVFKTIDPIYHGFI